MECDMTKIAYTIPKVGDIILIKNDNVPKMICCIDGYYDLVDMNVGKNITTHGGCMSISEILEDYEIEEIIPSEDLILKRIK